MFHYCPPAFSQYGRASLALVTRRHDFYIVQFSTHSTVLRRFRFRINPSPLSFQLRRCRHPFSPMSKSPEEAALLFPAIFQILLFKGLVILLFER